MNTKYILVLFVFLITASASAFAQQQSLFFMKNNVYSNEINPAQINFDGKWFLGLPALSNIDFSTNTNGFSYGDLIKQGSGIYADSLVMDIANFRNNVKKNNFIRNEYTHGIINFGFRSRKNFFTFGLNERVFSQTRFDEDLVNLICDGNASHLGDNMDISFGNYSINYHEFAFGFSREVNEKLSIGGKAKILVGLGAIQSDDMKISVYTAPDASYIDLQASGITNISGPVSFTLDEDGYVDEMESDFNADYATNTSNMGFALDWGATYTIDENWRVGVSLVDFGSIKWDSDLSNLRQNGSFHYIGADISDDVNSGSGQGEKIEETFDNLVDSISDSFRMAQNSDAFTTGLPVKLYFSGEYIANEIFNFGALTRLRMIDGYVGASLTLSANANIQDWLNLTTTYSMVEGTYNNVGLAMAIRGGAFQYYLASDNVLAGIDPTTTGNVNFRMGINLLFGRK